VWGLNGFSLFIAFGALLGLGWMAWELPRRKALAALDAAVWVLIGALIGGRIGFVLFSWPYFESHLVEAPQFWLGGLSGAGALLGALLGLYPATRLTRQRLAVVADTLIRPAYVFAISAWLGCWATGIAYGPATGSLGLPAQDELGDVRLRFPTQLLGALLSFAMLWLLEPQRTKRLPAGTAAALGFAGLSLQMLVLSFLRADPAPVWLGLRPSIWGAALASLVALGILGWMERTRRQNREQGINERVESR
jgi:phosphatidylglycerol:prolipoprotein diacylglycerol transferase